MYQNSGSTFAIFHKAFSATSTAQTREDCTKFFLTDHTPSNMSARVSLTFRATFISHGAS